MPIQKMSATSAQLHEHESVRIISPLVFTPPSSGWLSPIICLALMLSALGCGGAQPARDELSKTRELLDSVRKKGCAHDSLSLAEQSYAKSQKLFDEKRYDESRTQAAVAHQLAQEAAKAIGDQPCEVPPADAAPPADVKPFAEEGGDDQVEPFTEETTADLKTIYFGFDSVAFSADALQILEENLEWIRAHPDENVVISGHCDERGTAEYNLALGDQRAQKVANYLKQSNIDPKRLEIVTYGSERPISFRHDEEGHRLNRRVEFSIARR